LLNASKLGEPAHNGEIGYIKGKFPKQSLAVGVLTVLLRGLGVLAAADALAARISCCKLPVRIDVTLKNTW
jgi:hypothetical protein